MNKVIVYVGLLLSFVLFNSCKEGEGLNIFPVSKDKELGAQVAAQIESDKANYPLLDTVGGPNGNYLKAHQFLYNIVNKI